MFDSRRISLFAQVGFGFGFVFLAMMILAIVGVCFAGFQVFYGEFDPGSGRTLAACLTHASRAVRSLLAGVHERRTGE